MLQNEYLHLAISNLLIAVLQCHLDQDKEDSQKRQASGDKAADVAREDPWSVVTSANKVNTVTVSTSLSANNKASQNNSNQSPIRKLPSTISNHRSHFSDQPSHIGHQKSTVRCLICLESFLNRAKYLCHIESMEPFHCRVCNMVLCNYEMLKTHMWLCHHCILHQCKYCNHISFDDSCNLTHKAVLMDSFECEFCTTILYSFHDVQKHSLQHIRDPWLMCHYCSF